MKEFVYYSELFNIYGFMLTEKQRDIFSLYYEENLSLSEIADLKRVSKSYIGKIVENVKQKLDYYESNLKHYKLLEEYKK